MEKWTTGGVGLDESMWVEKTEHYKALEKARKEAITYVPNSDVIHKDEIEWLLTKERGEAMLFTFFFTSGLWILLIILLYIFFG